MSVLISLSPNTELHDVTRALVRLCMPWTWRQTSFIDQARDAIAERYPEQTVVLTSAGRTALTDAVRVLQLPSASEVIVQAFTCLAVPAAIKAAGSTPVFADIDEKTYNLTAASVAERITLQTKALVVQHTFGIPADLDELRALADAHGLILIEDCAHSLGAEYGHQLVGQVGDLAILSFGRDKAISTVFGGALLTKNKAYAERAQVFAEARPHPPHWWVAQQLLHPVLMAIVKPLYFQFGLGKLLLVLFQRVKLVSFAVTPREKEGQSAPFTQWRYAPALASLLPPQFKKLKRYTDKRRQYAAQYAKTFSLPPHNTKATPSWLRFPVTVPNAHDLLKHAQAKKLFLGDWYRQPVMPDQASHSVSGYTPGSCPQAERAAKRVINLPTYPTLSDREQHRVTSFLKKQIHVSDH